jgi:hypothetical protein
MTRRLGDGSRQFAPTRRTGIRLPGPVLMPIVMRMFRVVSEIDLSGIGLTGAPTWAPSVDCTGAES